jgi:hypothetical protein
VKAAKILAVVAVAAIGLYLLAANCSLRSIYGCISTDGGSDFGVTHTDQHGSSTHMIDLNTLATLRKSEALSSCTD